MSKITQNEIKSDFNITEARLEPTSDVDRMDQNNAMYQNDKKNKRNDFFHNGTSNSNKQENISGFEIVLLVKRKEY